MKTSQDHIWRQVGEWEWKTCDSNVICFVACGHLFPLTTRKPKPHWVGVSPYGPRLLRWG